MKINVFDEMMKISVDIILLFSILSIPCKCQEPKFTCIGNRPFKNKDLGCSDFSEICVKKDDPECEGFQAICQQCPPSNMTVNALLSLLALSKSSKDVLEKKINDSAQQQKYLEKQLNYEMAKLRCTEISILVLLSVTLFILIFEIRFKLFTKCLEKSTNKERKGLYRSRTNETYENINDPNIPMNAYENMVSDSTDIKWQQNFDELLNKINGILDIKSAEKGDHVDKANKDHSISAIKFQVKNMETSITLYVSSDDNVVQIKRQICTKCVGAKLNYKQMQLKYKDRILDDNQYLLSNVESIHDIVQCEINDAINPSDIIVLKVHGKIQIPGLIQVNRNQTISDLKKLLSKFNNSDTMTIFKEKVELIDERTLERCALMDKDTIQVIDIENGHFIMHSIVGDADPILIGYSNVDLVSSVKKKLSDKLSGLCDEILLYYDGKYLEEDKFIFELEIPGSGGIEYWCLLKLDRLKITADPVTSGLSSKIFKATDTASNKDIFIRMYKFDQISNWKQSKATLSELRKCKLTKSHSRFLQLSDFYFDKTQLGISIEYLKDQSMREYASKTSTPFPENQIAKWSKQILEGLHVLHKHKVVYRDMKSSDIFLDGEENIKISGFGLFKYVGYDNGGRLEGLNYKVPSTTRYPPPEVINKNPFTMHTDVWSFGAILYKMVTGNNPYQEKKIKDLARQIEDNQDFEYQFSADVTKSLQNLIRSCLKIDPKARPTVDELLRHEFINEERTYN